MTNNDSFIDEVNEELRRDRLFAAFRRYGWIGGLLILFIVGGAAWNEWQKAQARAAAEGFGDALLAALAGDGATGAAALAAVPASAPGQAAVLALLRSAEALAAQDSAAAAAALAPVAADAALAPEYRHLALYRLALIEGGLTAEARTAALAELTAPGAPYRTLGMELQALDLVAAGRRDEALAMFTALAQDAQVTQALRQRVAQMIVALGGEAAGG
ncbi:MAG: tetratricopeptide repeat protein [Rhodobacteraceae bacterium]|nr:tetratricopeptide repeat protein [Paracoccaceae bacterium]